MNVHKRLTGGNTDAVAVPRSKKIEVAFDAHGLRRRVAGQTARALLALVKAGPRGVTALEVSSWALRFAAYTFELRHDHHLDIETVREEHDGGWHGRHVLRTPVRIVRVIE